MSKDKYMQASVRNLRLGALLAFIVIATASGLYAGDDESFGESVSNLWDKVSTATSSGAKKTKDKSFEIGKKVGNKTVEVWDEVWDEDEEPIETEADFSDENVGVESLDVPSSPGVPSAPKMHGEEVVEDEGEDLTTRIGSSAASLWGKVAEAFTSDDSGNGVGYPSKAALWDDVSEELGDIAERLQKQDTLPLDSLFGEDKESNRKKINKMLTDILEILEVSNVSERRQEYAKLEEEILAKNTEIISYREKMVVAPNNVEGVEKVWKNSVEDYIGKISIAKSDIQDLKSRQQSLLADIKRELQERSGIKLSEEQVYSLVVMVSGDSFITLNSVFYNTKQLVGILEELVENNQDYINTIKKYYGMYAVLVEALKLSHEVEIDKIRNDYLPKINEYRVRAQIASKDTKKLIVKNAGNKQSLAMLEVNLRAQAEVYTAAGAYEEYLSNYLVSLENSKQVISSQLVVVMDTWKTTQLASGLLAVMKTSSQGLSNLISMELPSIKPLNISRLKDQFSMISMELRE